jgi:hypothetical protein
MVVVLSYTVNNHHQIRLMIHFLTARSDFYRWFSGVSRSATVSVALTTERSLAFDKETAAVPEEPQATGTVALRRKMPGG